MDNRLRKGLLALLGAAFVAASCWCSISLYSFYNLYKAAIRPFPSIKDTPSRLEESCPGTLAAVKNVAIIGAGAAGASTAYHLHRLGSPCQPLNITVFERTHYVGGRSTTVNVYDSPSEPVELGASIFVAVNHILVSTASELGLRSKPDGEPLPADVAGAELGVWDGAQFRFLLPRDEPAWRLAARLIWQYGTAPLRVQSHMRDVVSRFLTLYDEAWDWLTDAVDGADLLDVTGVTGAAFLSEKGVGAAYAQDIVQASTRVNYAQNLDRIHAVEAMVCMAADGGARAIQGGNWRIFAGMVAASNAHLRLETDVTHVQRREDGRFGVRTNTSKADQLFDAVVLAAPWHASGVAFEPKPAQPPGIVDYVHLHVTLFASPYRIRPEFFGLAADEPAPSTILTTLPKEEPANTHTSSSTNSSLPFFSVSLLRKVKNPSVSPERTEYAYKVFSPAPLTTDFLHSLLDVPESSALASDGSTEKLPLITWQHRKLWHSYPYLPPRTAFDGPAMPFEGEGEGEEIGGGLWYTGGIEPFISTMETSSLMGRNVAKLVSARFARVDRESRPGLRVQGRRNVPGKTEL